MVWTAKTRTSVEHSFEELIFLYVDEMLALFELTKPGPFLKRTPELGSYLGIREAGQLVAMAGERLKPYGYTEISCLHPSRLPGARIRQLTSLHSDAEDRKME